MDRNRHPRPERRPLVNIERLALYLSDTERHIRRLVHERRIPHLTVGKLIRFDLDDIDRWLDDHRRGI